MDTGKKDSKRRIALVSRAIERRQCFGPYLKEIAEIAEANRAEVLLLSLYSYWNDKSPVRPSQRLFFSGKKWLKLVIFESANWEDGSDFKMQIWEKGKPTKYFIREFAKSGEARIKKLALLAKFPKERVFRKRYGILYCGEVGAIKVNHDTKEIVDEFGFLPLFNRMKSAIILGPSHSLFRRWEFSHKFSAFSANGRIYLNVHCETKGFKAAAGPWLCYRNGKNCTDEIKEVPGPIIKKRPDFRMGIVTLQ